MASADLKVVITGDARGLSRAYGDAERASGRFGRSVGKMGMLAGGAVVAGVGLMAVGLKKSADAAMEAEKAQASLAAQMQASGLSMEKNRGAIDQTVQSLSRMSGIDDEALTGAFTRLLRSTGDVAKAQQQMMLVADMARAKQMDVAAAADVVGKAVDGNVGILKRYGVEIEKGATVTEALGAAQQAFAGQAQAYGATTAGAQDRVRVSVENVQEAIGARLLPALNQMLTWASSQLPKVEAFFNTHGGSIRAVLDRVTSFMKSVWGPVFDNARVIGQAMIAGVRKFMDEHGTEVRRILDRVGAAVSALATVMRFLVEKVVQPVLLPVLRTVLPAALGILVTAIDKVTGAIALLIQGIEWIGKNAVKVFKAAAGGLAGPLGTFKALLDPVGAALGYIMNTLRAIPEAVEKAKAAIGKVGSLVSGAAGLVGKLPGMATGGPVSQGRAYVVGERGPELFVPGASGTIVPNTRTPTAAGGTGGGGIVVNVTLPNYLGSPSEVAQIIRRELIQIGRNNAGNLFAGMA